jgi:hypothetical protein
MKGEDLNVESVEDIRRDAIDYVMGSLPVAKYDPSLRFGKLVSGQCPDDRIADGADVDDQRLLLFVSLA